jgi:hypothetical protein
MSEKVVCNINDRDFCPAAIFFSKRFWIGDVVYILLR